MEVTDFNMNNIKTKDETIIFIKKTPYELIEKEIKTNEVRLYRSMFKNITDKSILTFKNDENKITKKVNNIVLYDSFEELLSHENIKKTLPLVLSKEEGILYYNNLYKNYKLKKFKVMAIHLVSSTTNM